MTSLQLLSLADENADGLVDYAEFVPVALGVLEAIYAKRRFDQTREARIAEAEGETALVLPSVAFVVLCSVPPPFRTSSS